MGRRWTDQEVFFLQKHVGSCSLSAIAKKINRSETAVSLKLKRIGLGNTKKATGLLTGSELEKALQVDRKTVHHWIQHHGLEATSRVTCYERKFSLINTDAFWKWAEQNQEKIDFSIIEKHALPPEPNWVDEARKANSGKKIKAYKRWTTKEIDFLLKWRKAGGSFKDIAEELDRSRISVERCYARCKNT